MRLRTTFRYLALVGSLSAPLTASAQGDTAIALKGNVVRISSGDGSGQVGFGFIVGEQSGKTYIVTADHVVSTEDPDAPKPTVKIFFYSDQATAHGAEVLEHDTDHDLALLRVTKPPGFQWQMDCLAPLDEEKRDTPVWFIGRDSTWYVPAVPGGIQSDGTDGKQRLTIDMNQLKPGSSGGPLVTESGILGMVQMKAADDGRALSVDYIKTAVKGWGYPWQLEIRSLPLQGDWDGNLSFPTSIVFHLGPNGTGTSDSPDQNFFNIPISYKLQGNTIEVDTPSAGSQFRGTVNGDSISGTFAQGGANFPLKITRDTTSNTIQGDWKGNLPQTTLPLVLHFDANGSGTCDSTAQPGASGLPLQYTIQGNEVHFQIPSVNASFSGTGAGRKLKGNFLQNNRSVPIVFSKR